MESTRAAALNDRSQAGSSEAVLQGITSERSWQARLVLRFAPAGGKPVLTLSEHQGPLRVQQLFYPEKCEGVKPCHCYVLHPPGAVVNGDELTQDFTACKGARVLITTPSASKFYRSKGPVQSQRVILQADNLSELCYLPQETLLFDHCNAALSTVVKLAPSSVYVGAEILCFGRFDLGEGFAGGLADVSTKLTRAGKPLLTERLRVNPQQFPLTSPFTLKGCPCLLTLNAVGLEGQERALLALCTQLQEHLEQFAALQKLNLVPAGGLTGATCRGGVLSLRYLGHSIAQARAVELMALELIYPALLQRKFVLPRIWNT